jgi:hypothetical protein
VQLASLAGVSTWSLTIAGQDELVAPPSLSINSTTKTATYTAPAAGSALLFKSVVNAGVDLNGVAQPSYTTTFTVYTLTAGGKRVLASNERTEGSTSFGWIVPINTLIRGGGGSFTAGGDLTGTSSSQTVVQLTGSGSAVAIVSGTKLNFASNGLYDQQGASGKHSFMFAGTEKAKFDAAHGLLFVGGAGSDTACVLGPLTGNETSNVALWLLPNATAQTSANPAAYSDGTNLFINTRTTAGTQLINFAFGGNPFTMKLDGNQNIALKNTLSPPVSAGGQISIYASAGAGKAIGSSGTVTTWAAASIAKSILDVEDCKSCGGTGVDANPPPSRVWCDRCGGNKRLGVPAEDFAETGAMIETDCDACDKHGHVDGPPDHNECRVCGASGKVPTPEEKHCPQCGGDFGWQWENPVGSGAHPEAHEHLSVCCKCMIARDHKIDELHDAIVTRFESLLGKKDPELRALLNAATAKHVVVEEVA